MYVAVIELRSTFRWPLVNNDSLLSMSVDTLPDGHVNDIQSSVNGLHV